ncbi:PREDICTED: probable E3 SUMO-protein ligase RNF212 [Gekko japonicus]|uniref:Probable E3 SUMO-protein ligase RNF212 n=1 Tax=Gekko japonicus TaxID=146911 RepID=A0ABM1JPH3_GEKJA|nr:PREDICTED: probable E3 SUMO-protein ligase RNF212 [Gekko japonicus]
MEKKPSTSTAPASRPASDVDRPIPKPSTSKTQSSASTPIEKKAKASKKEECVICRVPCRTIILSREMNSDIQSLFMGIDGLCRKYSKEVSQISQFQEKHRGHLLTYFKGKITKLDGYWKATQHVQHTQYQQHGDSSMEVDYIPPSVRKIEPVAGSRISLISPPQNGHMGSVPCRSSRLSGLALCQNSTSESVRSTPLRMPSRETPYMSQIGSSQNNKISIPDAFGLRTPQHYQNIPTSSLPVVTRCPISLADLLQKQHLAQATSREAERRTGRLEHEASKKLSLPAVDDPINSLVSTSVLPVGADGLLKDNSDKRIEQMLRRDFEASANALRASVLGSLFARAAYAWASDLAKTDSGIPKDLKDEF